MNSRAHPCARCVATSFAFTLVLLTGVCSSAEAQSPAPANHWQRCNTHMHTGAAGPEVNAAAAEAVDWYRAHGYQCVFVTGHEHVADAEALNRRYQPADRFLVLSGQEITQMIDDASWPSGARHYHVNALGIHDTIYPVGWPVTKEGKPLSHAQIFLERGGIPKAPRDASAADLYARNFKEILVQGGVAQVNHPNYGFSVEPKDLAQLPSPFLLEVWNAFPTSNNLGGTMASGANRLSTEALWDELLTRGQRVWATASDDTHDYVNFDRYATSPLPGKAWIMVDSEHLEQESILTALRAGRFYASTGVTLAAYEADDREIRITLERPLSWTPVPPPRGSEAEEKLRADTLFETRFIGERGRVLAVVHGENPRYRFTGSERYVRASIVDSDGRRAWTQPVFHSQLRQSLERAASNVDADGTVQLSAMAIPYSSLASEGARHNFVSVTTGAERSPPIPKGTDITTARKILDDKRMRPVVERLRAIFPVTITPKTIGGVQTDVIEPAGGIASKNTKRVLINLHGGGFMFGARYAGQQESIPVASLGGFRIVTVDYRMAPEHKFPAASEDVAAVYKALLQQYEPRDVGIYGCSAGGTLTAQSIAWFQKHKLPAPGAVGIFGAGAVVAMPGDSNYIGALLANRVPEPKDVKTFLVYFNDPNLNLKDPLVSPVYSPSVMAGFPPSLLITGTRAIDLSPAAYTHTQLVKAGVDAALHVWEGATHCSFAQPVGNVDFPENREAWEVIVKFFESRLSK